MRAGRQAGGTAMVMHRHLSHLAHLDAGQVRLARARLGPVRVHTCGLASAPRGAPAATAAAQSEGIRAAARALQAVRPKQRT
eukprot:362738-Chlamydomonas_euryale.AAC.2